MEKLTDQKFKKKIRNFITLNSVTKDEIRKEYNEIFDKLKEYEDKLEAGNCAEIKTRCKDCVYCHHNEANRTYRCLFYKSIMRPDDFCSWGRKEGQEQ